MELGPGASGAANLDATTTSTTVTSGGLLRTTMNLIDGNSAMSTKVVDSTVVGSSGMHTETIPTSTGTTVTSLIQTVTSTTSTR